MKYMDDTTVASNPGNVKISKRKLKEICPELFGISGLILKFMHRTKFNWIDCLKEHVYYGDSNPAIVVAVEPLLVAAYTDELDCVVILNFPNHLVLKYNLKLESKLITINTYLRGTVYQKDIILGPQKYDRWVGYHPVIAEFISDNIEELDNKKAKITEDEWNYVYEMALKYIEKYPKRYRNGNPIYSDEES